MTRKYHSVALIPEGVWGQTVASLIFDPKRHPDYSKVPEKLTMYSWRDHRAKDLERIINDPSAYQDPFSPEFNPEENFAYFNWGNPDIKADIKVYSPLSTIERHIDRISEEAGLGEKYRAILQAVYDSDLIILAPRSSELMEYVSALNKIYSSAAMQDKSPDVLCLTKGIFVDDEGTAKVPYEIIEEGLPKRMRKAIMVGPNISSEIRLYLPATSVVATKHSPRRRFLRELSELLSGYHFRPVWSKHPNALGWATAVKNVVAIGVGIGNSYIEDTLKNMTELSEEQIKNGSYNSNLLGEIVTLGMRDGWHAFNHLLNRHGRWSKVRPEEYLLSFGALGDTITTADSENSRNVRFGYHFGKELIKNPHADREALIEDVVQEKIKQAVEGIPTARDLQKLIKTHKLQVPFFEGVSEMLFGDLTPDVFVEKMFETAGRYETYDDRILSRLFGRRDVK
ncbi:hypothetical protein D6764_03960 [Candidatus Woesearchaeota archaeon]|nr:MAG: hypothetical protein D6764_03960 [Candidatus Woesearchaeota archaeon]